MVAIHGEKLDPWKMREENGENTEVGRRLRRNRFTVSERVSEKTLFYLFATRDMFLDFFGRILKLNFVVFALSLS